ncbi:hypothetical protein ACFFHM_02015 [Halalkalibacter kiskunsagensis]|uniref:Alkyl hydroperoxide reductase subunit C/ Thiol specific antioxidant domain-containing protein n=1 Tax=Halalkalibacter kiskunsagensis TaxID=1548599 RepID=A0ABV6K7Q4_9BACI
MSKLKRSYLKSVLVIAIFLIMLTGCGSTQSEPEGELSLLNEQGEEVTLTNKERATVLFHFTEVG